MNLYEDRLKELVIPYRAFVELVPTIPIKGFEELVPTIPKEAFRELFPGQRVAWEYLLRVKKDLVVEGWYREQIKNARKSNFLHPLFR